MQNRIDKKRIEERRIKKMTDENQNITPDEWRALTAKNITTMRANNAWMIGKGYRTPPDDTEGELDMLRSVGHATP